MTVNTGEISPLTAYCMGLCGAKAPPPRPLLTVPNVTMASVPTLYYSVWHYNCLWSLKGT